MVEKGNMEVIDFREGEEVDSDVDATTKKRINEFMQQGGQPKSGSPVVSKKKHTIVKMKKISEVPSPKKITSI